MDRLELFRFSEAGRRSGRPQLQLSPHRIHEETCAPFSSPQWFTFICSPFPPVLVCLCVLLALSTHWCAPATHGHGLARTKKCLRQQWACNIYIQMRQSRTEQHVQGVVLFQSVSSLPSSHSQAAGGERERSSICCRHTPSRWERPLTGSPSRAKNVIDLKPSS